MMTRFMNKIFLLGIFFLLAVSLSAAAENQQDYVQGEIIIKLKQTSSVNAKYATIEINAEIQTGPGLLGKLFSKHKVKSIEKVVKNFEILALRANQETIITEKSSLQTKYGIDRLYLLKLEEDADINNAIRDLNSDPNIEYAEPNYLVHTTSIPNDPSFANLWGLHNTGQTGGTIDADIDAPEAWDLQTGSNNVVVAVIDTGIDYAHEDLAANIWANPGEIAGNNIDDDGNGFIDDVRGWDFYTNDNNPFDDHGHGTHVAGTIGAVGDNGKGISGVSWNVKIMPIKFLGSSGSGTTTAAINAINYATLMGANIMSNSWGGGGYSQALRDAIEAANSAGILFVAAAGNSASNNDISPAYPASYDNINIVSVAATDHNDNLASFSNYGANSVDVAAPGVNTYSTVPTGSCSLCHSSGYNYASGTSMATPHVSGAAALIKSQYPLLTHLQIKDRLLYSTDYKTSLNGKTLTGGRLNAFNSLENDATAPSAITDLAPSSKTFNSVVLAWTAVGDDGATGSAIYYDLRYSTSPINELNFESATRANLPKPKTSGSAETFRVSNLVSSTTYYFAIKSVDNVGNKGAISNIVSETTSQSVVFFSDDFESGVNGWALENGNGTNSSLNLWHMENAKSNSPVTSWTYNTGSPNYNFNTGSRNFGGLVSPQIDLTSKPSALLQFYDYYQTETTGTSYDRRFVQVSVNNGPYVNIVQLSNDPMNSWHQHEFDISAYAGNIIKIKFFFDSIDSIFNGYWGWSIDDFAILVDSANNGSVNNLPVADANGPYFWIEDILLKLDGSGSFDPTGQNLTYQWDFGDGTPGIGGPEPLAFHNYTRGGTYIITLIVHNGINWSLPDTTFANITEVNDAPIAIISGLKKNVSIGEVVIFNGSDSSDEEGTPLIYYWDFGDGNALSSNNSIVNYTYAYPGNFTVVLTVSDGDSKSSDIAQINVILPPNVTFIDLIMTDVTPLITTIAPGQSFYLFNKVKNQGTFNAGSFSVGFSLLNDKLGEIKFNTARFVPSLAKGASSSAWTRLTIPANTSLTKYNVCAFADINDSINELNEINNMLCDEIVITRPDLVMTLVNGPSVAARGHSITVENKAYNQGKVASGPFIVGIYLSSDDLITPSDRLLARRTVRSLLASGSNSAKTTLKIPSHLASGKYYLGAIADSTKYVIETDETNNALAGNIIAII